MVSLANPFTISLGAVATIALLFLSAWRPATSRLHPMVESYRLELERADIAIDSDQLLLGIVASSAVLWLGLLFFTRPAPAAAALLLALCLSAAYYGCRLFIRVRIRRRLALFNAQLEPALRLLANGLRVGLGVRQSIALITTEMPDPARHEFARLLAQMNIGLPMPDAFEGLAARMPSAEMLMMGRVIQVQTQVGGNLARVLDNLAETIKSRRRIIRKTRSLTAEGRMSALVIGALPIGVGIFTMTVQPHMRAEMLGTNFGHIALGIVASLELTAAFILNRLLAINV